jgi:hypothetical protein
MKFDFFSKKFKCEKCGSKFKNEPELTDHQHTAHAT